jgi:putative addiction module component (TIGR02574 family)
MSEYESVLSAALQLSEEDRLRLIDELASSVPDDQPPTLSDEWLAEIERRSAEIDSGAVMPEPWPKVRQRLFRKHGLPDAD